MEISKAELASKFQTLTDAELIRRLHQGTMTPLALAVAQEELRSRGVELPRAQPAEAPTNEPVTEIVEPAALLSDTDDTGEGVDLVTLARFSNSLKANVLRACLESHGLFAHVWGDHLGIAHFIWSNAGGGIRVKVRADQLAQAQGILEAFERGDYSLDDDVEPAGKEGS
jgi:hypothetical protein